MMWQFIVIGILIVALAIAIWSALSVDKSWLKRYNNLIVEFNLVTDERNSFLEQYNELVDHSNELSETLDAYDDVDSLMDSLNDDELSISPYVSNKRRIIN